MLDEEILGLYRFLSTRVNTTNISTDINEEVKQYTPPPNYKRMDNVRIKSKNFRYSRKTRILSKGLILG